MDGCAHRRVDAAPRSAARNPNRRAEKRPRPPGGFPRIFPRECRRQRFGTAIRCALPPRKKNATSGWRLDEALRQQVRDELKKGASVSTAAKKFGTSRQTIMRARDEIG
ncbi:MAG: hypothetical protein EOQ42_19320 [Mesorhizobium sp.]|nr:MAG: hypothetical protein EOQ42_19320 [Mesorhizobium sp.]RWE91630.1 MAG: hypothetical protein EOS43_32310 [Mesorhizobium sp.]